MKRYRLLSLKWVVALLLVVGFVSCADEEIVSEKADIIEGIETEMNLAFTSATPSVQTRGALDVKQEYKVYNCMFLCSIKQVKRNMDICLS